MKYFTNHNDMPKIQIKINDDDLIAFEELPRKIKSMRKPLMEALNFMELETKNQFVVEMDYDGIPWAKLSPRTIDKKHSDVILRDKGLMVNSMFTRITGSFSGEFGLDSEYAIYHQEGTSKMPARKIVGMNDRRIRIISEMFLDFVGEGLS